MRIANNIMAMNTHRQYTINNNNVAKSAEKLSSGYRVNRAGDDAAGLAISEKMRAQIRGLNMAAKNSQDGNSLIQTAEGALQEVHSILQRMNELSVQSATGTNQTLDRNALNAEFQQLREEIDDISAQTTFNDMNILDGTFKQVFTVDPSGTPATVSATISSALVAGKVTGATTVSAARPNEAGTYSISLKSAAGTAGTKDAVYTMTFTDGTNTTTTDFSLADIVQGVDFTKPTELVKSGETFFLDLTTFGLGSYEATVDAAFDSAALNTAVLGAVNALAFEMTTDDSLQIQVGAKEAEQMLVRIDEVTSTTLGLTNRAIDNQTAAGRAISITRSAINQVSTIRGALGAAQNRLDHKIANLNNSVENLAAAESRIRDVDMASEMTQFTKANVLSQASTAMLAQANALPQNVLSLLR